MRTIVRRRRSNASRIMATSSNPPVSAARAARCETFATLDVSWLWMLVAAAMASEGPMTQPTRHPVMA